MREQRWWSVSGNTQDTFFPRATAAAMPTIVSGHGPYLIDDRGCELIDVCSGPFLTSIGQGNERVIAAMSAQARRLTYTYSRSTRHEANGELSARLSTLAGPGFERVHLTSGGSEANEMAVKMLRARAVGRGETGRCRIISLMPGYHGATVQTLAMNGDVSAHALWGPLTVEAALIPAPLTFRAASPQAAATASLAALQETFERLGAETVLALIIEPIGGQASGVNVPDPSFVAGAREICDRNGVALVFDEIVTAFRTGTNFVAHDQPDVLPDIITVAKGLGAGYVPLGAVLTSAELTDELAGGAGFVVSHSYDACPMACAAGSAVLDEIVEHDLVGNADRVGTHLRARLEELAARQPLIGDVRGRGLLQAIELVADPATAAKFPAHVDPGAVALQIGLDHGLLLYSRRQNGGAYGDWLLVAPPLTTDATLADTIVDRLAEVLTETARRLTDLAVRTS